MPDEPYTMTPDKPVFLSYSRRDRDFVIQLYDELKDTGVLLS
jgi:hypothetical protein